MASVINTNNASLIAQRNLSTSQSSLTTSVQRLSSGLRINSAKDDAAGLGISQKLQSQITGANVAARNANDAISMVSTAEGGMQEVSSMLQRMRELSTQGNNDSLDNTQRGYIATEITALKDEINAVGTRTTFNGKSLLDGSISGGGVAYASGSLTVGAVGTNGAAAISSLDVTGASTTAATYTMTSDGAGALTMTRGSDNYAETITMTAAQVTAGSAEMNFSGLGVKMTLAVNTSAADAVDDVATLTSFTTAASASAGEMKFQVGTKNGSSSAGAGDTADLASLFKSVKVDATGNLTALNTAITAATSSTTSADMGLLTAAVDDAIDTISGFRSDLGAMNNRLDHNIANLQSQSENLTASKSRITDTDYALETATLSKNQVMSQAATAMLAQANQMPNAVLSLLK
jgi:flagellin